MTRISYRSCWPQQYKEEHQATRQQVLARRYKKKPSVLRSVIGSSSREAVLPIPSYESDEDEKQYIYDPNVPAQPDV